MIIRDKICNVFDIEVFPNIFSCTIKNTETGEIITFEISQRKNDVANLIKYFTEDRNKYFVGYNNIHYDNPIINYIIEWFGNNNYGVNKMCISLFNLSKTIIQNKNEESWLRYKYADHFDYIDLLTMLYSKALRVSLKSMQVTMMYPNVQEFTEDWKKPLDPKKFDEMILYNINDVNSTSELLERCKEDIELRLDIENKHHINCLSKDGVGIGVELLKNKYIERTGISKKELESLRSPADKIALKDVILPIIEFKSKILQDLLKEMKTLTVSPSRNGWNKKFIFHDRVISIGVGGIHSINKPEIIIPNDDELLLDTDAQSLYPTLILKWKFIPKHLGQAFADIYEEEYIERIAAKKAGRKLEDKTKKLLLNSVTGNYQNEYSWMYSPFAVMQIRMNGQLLLLMLAERLIEIGCRIIQYNTDGLFLVCPKNKKNEYDEVIKNFESISKLTMETEEFKAMYQLAINDYFAITKDDKIKEKGIFITNVLLGKGLTPKIIPKAIQAFFINNIPVSEYIKNNNDIRNFLMSEKTGQQWTVEYLGKKQQRTNRFYASTNGGKLLKYQTNINEEEIDQYDDDTNNNYSKLRITDMLTASPVTLLNKFEDKPIKDYNINYNYYINECLKIIEALKPSQLTLW